MTGVQTCALPIYGAVGSVTSQKLVAITGCQAMGAVGNVGVFYWSLIDDNETANWQNISNAQTPTWGVVNTAESAEWDLITTE